MTVMEYADLYEAMPVSLLAKGYPREDATLGMFWVNRRPSQITLSIRCREQYQVWTVGRSLFVVTAQDWCKGAWMGAGDFSMCHAELTVMLRFAPVHSTERVILAAPAKPIDDFIANTRELVDVGEPEEAINIQALDAVLAKILG